MINPFRKIFRAIFLALGRKNQPNFNIIFLLLGSIAIMPGHASQEKAGPKSIVHVIEVESIITPVSAEFITKSIERAENEGAQCLIIELDTPGGLLESTRQITKRFLAAEIPIVVYVSPQGSRAASAGVFITYAAHVAAMAPSTNIGAAHPVNIQGGADTSSVMNDKVTNDAVAQVKALAEKRGRNIDWAEKAVRESVSITEQRRLRSNRQRQRHQGR